MTITKFLCRAILLLAVATAGIGQKVSSDALLQGFVQPPNSARPRVWWHWMNGNITETGIKLDLEWMHRVGLGGFQTFDASMATPQVVDRRLVYMTPEWKSAFRYATSLGDELGMEMAIAGSPGWSETGGPWVPPAEGMKKYVWSELRISGGAPFTGQLPHPPSNSGVFQNLGVHDVMALPPGAKPIPEFYADAAVIAFRRPVSDLPLGTLHPTITASAGHPDLAVLDDGDLLATTDLPIPKVNESSWIQYEFTQPQTLRALTVVMKDFDEMTVMMTGIPNPTKSIEASDDGINFRTIAAPPGGAAPEYTISFAPVAAKYFRVLFRRAPPPPLPAWFSGIDLASLGLKIPPPPTDYKIAELELHLGARVNRFEEKAAFIPVPDLYPYPTPDFTPADCISKSEVLDLTSKMHPGGTLDWTPPAGEWIVLRFGYSLTGITNHPATAEATGLEVDKLDRQFVKNYMDRYLDTYKDTVSAQMMGKRGLRYVITDSWEAGAQNWSNNMIAEFTARRGYDPRPWLPVLAGYVVESSAASDGFLWDLRKTIADLTADAHYGQVQASLRERGMGHYGESHEDDRALIADGMEVKKLDDIPMSAMWVQLPGVYTENYDYNADDRESASVAHIYGQNLAAAESLTAAAAPWAWSPATLKPVADQELLNGINRFVIHESAHQPLVGKAPGLTLGPFGQWFNRNETWAEQAGPWVDYLARSSYMMQQGRFAADLVYFYGEDSNLTAIFHGKAPDIPAGYGFDYINADALIHELSVVNGRLVAKSGMSYRVLGLDPYSRHMSLPVLRAIHALVEQGAIVAGPKPLDDPSLSDDHAAFTRVNDELFGDGTGVRPVGKGKVFAGENLSDVFAALQLPPDFDYSKPESDLHVAFAHRHLSDGDLYFVSNRGNREEAFDAIFRVQGKMPEIWRAETGGSQPVSYNMSAGRTTVPLRLEPWGSVFIVFRKNATEISRVIPEPAPRELATLADPWKIEFQPDRGAPASVTMDKLISWTESPDPGVKYFSGSAAYTTSLHAERHWFKPRDQQWLDLGEVKELAAITVNGKELGIVWHAPFRVNLTGVLKPGENRIIVKVTNTWVNRLIGDQQPDATVKYTFADVKPYSAKSTLKPSGLLGPVRLLAIEKDTYR